MQKKRRLQTNHEKMHTLPVMRLPLLSLLNRTNISAQPQLPEGAVGDFLADQVAATDYETGGGLKK